MERCDSGVSFISNGILSSVACYENPLFDEDGTVLNDSRGKVPRQVDGIRTKNLELNSVQTSVHYTPAYSSKRKALKVLAVIVAIVAVIGLIVGIIVGQRQDGSSPSVSQSKSDPVLFSTKKVEGSFRIIQGPFSIYKPEYSVKSSSSFSIFSSSFTYQIDSIFKSSEFSSSYSHTELVNISSGSVKVHFIIHFHQDVQINRETESRLADILKEGVVGSLYVIDTHSLQLTPVDPALSVITTSKPGVCISIHMNECVNVTSWSLTTFPNILGHTSPAQALDEANKYIELFYGPCAKDFWCTIWNPKCHHSKGQRPCRSYCQAVFDKCKNTYETDISTLVNCNDFPDSEDPDVCSPDPFKPGTCVSYKEEMCGQFGYDHVALPGFAGFRHPAQGTAKLQIIAGINHATHCYKHSRLFGCAALIPRCTNNGVFPVQTLPPCRSLCENFKKSCEIFMDIFWDPWPEDLHCSDFPDSPDPKKCIGWKEAHEPPEIEECKIGEERCDNSSCIPLKWKCDDYNDCKDGKDEEPIDTDLPLQKCAVCPPGMIRCSPSTTVCIDATRRCDGIEDCTTASDEEDCVQLGDGGRSGELTVYNPDTASWEPVCADGWDDEVNSKQICSQLLYKKVERTTTITSWSSSAFVLSDQKANADPNLIQSNLTRRGTCMSGKMVAITCDIPECGIRPAFTPPLLRIVGGDLADPNAWPWHVSLHGGMDMKYFCGGSILAERWILTAGHCIGGYFHRQPTSMTIKVGQPRRDTYSPYLQTHYAERLYLHPGYNKDTVNNDIALILLKDPVKFNDHVRPICLPQSKERIPVGTRCTAIGWGKRNETAIYYERQMKQVYLEIVNQDSCNSSIRGADRKVPYILTNDMFCAGGGLGHDACSGDSGGPLLCSLNVQNDTWFVGGVVSWGVGCAYPNVPGVYTSLPSYLDWIRNVTGLSYL